MMLRLLITLVLLSATSAFAQSVDTLKPNKVVVHDIQVQLAARGYKVGTPDGAIGSKTIKAFEDFAKEAGVADAPLDEQLRALGIDLSAVQHLTFALDGPYLTIENELDNGIDRLNYQYDWKSFEVGRYIVNNAGEELFTLDDQYCDRYATANSDCDTKRARVQVNDATEPSARHVLYSFDFRVDALPDAIEHIQFAELTQQGGIKAKHPETGKPVNYSPRFTLEVQEGSYIISDNAMLDVSLTGGQNIKPANIPVRPGEWVHFDLEAIWSTGEEGLFRYWVDSKAIWERKGRNATCIPGESKGECSLKIKYGPYLSNYDGPSFVDAPVKVAFRNVNKTISEQEIAAKVGGLPMDFLVATKREGGATKDTDLVVTEQHGSDPSRPGKINSHLHVAISDAPKGEDQVDFNVQGDMGKNDFFTLRMIFNPPIGTERPAGLHACIGPKTDVYDDGKHRAALEFRKVDNAWVAIDAECYLKNVPAKVQFMIRFVQTRFRDLAADMVTSGNIGMVSGDAYRDWLIRIANGEIDIR